MTENEKFDNDAGRERQGNVKSKKAKKKCLTGVNAEKAVLVYLSLAERYPENRDLIKYGAYSDLWDKMFTGKNLHDPRDMKLQGYKDTHNNLDSKSLEEIYAYRNTFAIYAGTEVPKDIKALAMEKNAIVSLAENRNKQLSGFDILVKFGKRKHETERIITVPFSLSETEIRKKLCNMPTRAEVIAMEQKMTSILRDSSTIDRNKIGAVHKYKAPYATHEFKVFMNRFVIHQCKSKELTNACCLLCNRVRIRNLSNNAPIAYRFCEGSGQRKRNMKRVNKRRKNAKKAAQ